MKQVIADHIHSLTEEAAKARREVGTLERVEAVVARDADQDDETTEPHQISMRLPINGLQCRTNSSGSTKVSSGRLEYWILIAVVIIDPWISLEVR